MYAAPKRSLRGIWGARLTINMALLLTELAAQSLLCLLSHPAFAGCCFQRRVVVCGNFYATRSEYVKGLARAYTSGGILAQPRFS